MTSLWWLSFADPALPEGSQFLGVCIVQAADMIEAARTAHRKKLNPGGQVAGYEIPIVIASHFPHRIGVLMNRAECEAFELELVGARESRSAP